MLTLSPIALRMIKAGFQRGRRRPRRCAAAGCDATMLFYMSEEGQEGRNAYVERRKPDFSKFPKRP